MTDQNLNSYINKYNEFCNYRLSYTHLGETLERTFIKWKNHQDVLAQPKKLNPSYVSAPQSLMKIKQESPNTGDIYTFTLNPNTFGDPAIPQTPSSETTNPTLNPNTPTKQATDHLVTNYLQNNHNTIPDIQQFQRQSCEMNQTVSVVNSERVGGGKDIEKAKKAHDESRKRKCTTVITPDERRSVGRPTRHDVLTKIANEASDKDELLIYSRNLIQLLTAAKRKEKQSLQNMVKT